MFFILFEGYRITLVSPCVGEIRGGAWTETGGFLHLAVIIDNESGDRMSHGGA